MRTLIAVFLFLAVGWSSTSVADTVPNASGDPAREYLLASAAADFHAHGPAPTHFRKVRYGIVESAGGGSMPIICGEFQTEAKGEDWIVFATLKTSAYEQWIGDDSFCRRPAFGWYEEDLSAEMQKRVDALN